MASSVSAVVGSLLIEDTFTLHGKSPRKCHVVLDTSGLGYRVLEAKCNKFERLALRDIAGCLCLKQPLNNRFSCDVDSTTCDTKSAVYFSVYAYPLRRKAFGGLKRQRVAVTFQVSHYDDFSRDLKVAEFWKSAIIHLVRGIKTENSCDMLSLYIEQGPANAFLSLPARRVLVIVNPVGGQGKAISIFDERVRPIFAEGGVDYDMLITKQRNHARDFVQATDLTCWAGIIVVSGDGLLHEVYNGLVGRADWLKSIRTPIGIVPAGSGNGLAKAILHSQGEPTDADSDLVSCIMNVATGTVVPVDLVRVVLSTGKSICSFLSVGWGIMANIDIESERLRAIGEPRFTIYALLKLLDLKSYRGKLSYLLAQGCSFDFDPQGLQRSVSVPFGDSGMKSVARSQSCDVQMEGSGDSGDTMIVHPVFSCKQNGGCLNGDMNFAHSENLPLSFPVPDDWVSLEEDFLSVYAVYPSHIASSMYFAPQAKLDDGLIWLYWIRAKDVSRLDMLNFLLAIETGKHVNLPFVNIVPCHAMRLEPLSDGTFMTVDGEVVDYGPVQAEVLPSVARLMGK